MLIGSGMLANVFMKYKSNKEVVIFASGVSNSLEVDKNVFLREEKLLLDTLQKYPNKRIVYFSTCSIEDDSVKNSPYVQHKIKLESILKKKSSSFYIFRLSQVVGDTKSNTLINYLFNAIQFEKSMLINKGSTRNLLWIEDAFFIVDYIIRNNIYSNEIVNVSSPYNIYVIELVSKIEKILQKKAKYELVSQGKNQEINIDKILSIQCLKNLFEDKYIDNVLKKFYKDVFLKTNY